MPVEDRLWRPEKAAWYLDVKTSWVYEAVRTGRLPCHRVGRHWSGPNDKWWTNDAHTETFSALATWRAELDDAGQDPRDELAFQTQLTDYSHTLKQEGGGVTKPWKPGAPPVEWAGG
jgi:excisionase family DNA binding protein